jgi:MSHA pilin protein MshD
MCTSATNCQRGLTLIELIVFMVIVSVALAGVLVSLNVSVRNSADPLQSKQALAIAEGLMEEIQLKSYCDPDGVGTDMTTTPPTCGTNTIEARASRDAVDDFDTTIDDGLATVITTDLLGTAFPAFVTSVTVEVSSASLGPAAVPVRRVIVRVNYGSGNTISLTGYRANF